MNADFIAPKSKVQDGITGWKSVKVAMLVRIFSSHGGLELYTYQLVRELLSRGLNITVICEELQTNFVHQNLNIIQISPSKPKSSKVSKLEHYIKEFSQAITRHGPFDIVHSQHLGAHNVDVVTFHNHTVTRLNQYGTLFEKTLNKMKLLFRPDYILRDEVDAMLVRESKVLIFPSRICRQDFVERFQFHKKSNMASLIVAYPGGQLANSNAQSETKIPDKSELVNANNFPKEKTILFVGRGYRKKGLDILLSACLLLKQKNYSFKLLIAGLSAKPLDRWQLNVFGLDKNVSYLGFVKNMDKLYQSASIITMPSRAEPFGMSAVQAMNYGLVPIVSKVSGIAELLQENTDALILRNHLDSKELANHIADLFDHPQKLTTMSKAAQSKAQTITWEGTVEATLNAYQQIFQQKYVI